MKVHIYKGNDSGRAIRVVFYLGRHSVLYAWPLKDDSEIQEIIDTIKKGIHNKELISMERKKLDEENTFMYSLSVDFKKPE